MNRPHFRAEIRIHESHEGGPQQGFFLFPESGVRNVPLGMAGVEGYNTVQLRHEPNARVANGARFLVDCTPIVEGPYLEVIAAGRAIELWDGRVFASGRVIEVFPANWIEKPGLPPKR